MLLGFGGLGMSSSVQAELLAAAAEYGIPSQVLLNMAQQESGGNQAAVSSEGAIGVMQLMPATAASLGVDPTNEQQNIQGGAEYLSQLYTMFGSWNLAVAAYNCGPGCIEEVLAGTKTLPNETANYVQAILGVPFDPTGQAQGVASGGAPAATGTLTASTGGTLSTVTPVAATGTLFSSADIPLLLMAAAGAVLLVVVMD
jgi:hypothetical protein